MANESKPKTASKKAPAKKPATKKPAAKKKAAPKKAPAKKTTAEKSKGGRPTDYRESYNDQVRKLCLLGAKDKEIADFFGIAESTLNLWKDAHPLFMESIKEGKGYADANVAESLYKRALGFNVKEVREETGTNGEKTTITDRYIPSDTTAATFWLSNRQGKKWRRVITNENKNINVDVNDLDDEELDRKLKMLEAD